MQLTARPIVVARESAPGKWAWEIDAKAQETLRSLIKTGAAGSAQRRNLHGRFVLLAWSVQAQREVAEQAERERKYRQQAERKRFTPRAYRPAARAVAMMTHAPYQHEPARW